MNNLTNLKRKIRRMTGMGVIMIVTLIGLLILPLIAMFAFEVSRTNLASQQLKNAADAAALAAVATMASQDNNDMADAQKHARAVALSVFKANSVLGSTLTNSSITGSLTGNNPNQYEGQVYIQFLDPNTLKEVPDGDPNGKVVRLTAFYGMVPAFGKFVGLSKQTIIAASNGAVPQLDVVVCFDISGSIDDQTEVTFVKRFWDAAANKTRYPKTTHDKLGIAEGKIFDLVHADPTGTGLNGYGLQQIITAETETGYWSGMRWTEAHPEASTPLRSKGAWPEDGIPPGNAKSGTPGYSASDYYTDEVVNIDGKKTFGGITTTDGFSFPDLGTLVEASRGNLETKALMDASFASSGVTVTPKVGYKACYEREALKHLQPIQDAKDATQLFCQIINNDTDAHFGLVTFDDLVGSDENSTENNRTINASGPAYGENKAIAQPLIPLDKGLNQTQFNKMITALGNGINNRPLVAKGSTNIGLAVKTAADQIKNNGRINSVKAIVLFTDGQPTAGGPFSSDVWSNARQAAVYAKNLGIPCYTIGLATNAAIIPGETAILNASNSNPASGGIAGITGQGATFHLVTNSKELRAAFQKIARHLVQLVREQYNE